MNNEMNNEIGTELAEDSVENENPKNKNTTIIVLAVAIVLAAIVLSVALISVAMKGREASKEPSANYVVTTGNGKGETTTKVDLEALLGGDSDDTVSENGGSSQQGGSKDNIPDVNVGGTSAPTKNSMVEYYEQLSPNGENKLSDHYENKYIKKVTAKYSVDADLLVAIYSDPDTGNNFVLQFNGKTDGDGMIIKSPDTLEKVYHIDKNGKISVATGKETGNEGVSYAEGAVVFNMVKVIVMEQYPNYFTGLKK